MGSRVLISEIWYKIGTIELYMASGSSATLITTRLALIKPVAGAD